MKKYGTNSKPQISEQWVLRGEKKLHMKPWQSKRHWCCRSYHADPRRQWEHASTFREKSLTDAQPSYLDGMRAEQKYF
jgi:hypothetical protein